MQYLSTVAEWGFPLDGLDLRLLAKSYLDRSGQQTRFLNNLPGVEWVCSFLKRHRQELNVRICQNIKRNRAAVGVDDVTVYFDNLTATLRDVQPENIINYDETNLSDDPGKPKCIFKRGTKYPERIMNSTKGSISLMFSGTASGELLPTYVVYKADHLWDTWTQGGPPNTRYNRSKSGWFDSTCFSNWFDTIVVPYCRGKDGTKVVIGDNLSSHFSEHVLRTCANEDIRFVCLPPNATHLAQPLDVAFFRPLKMKWRKILSGWKMANVGRSTSMSKDQFPNMLNDLLTDIQPNVAKNLKAGFTECGIVPLDRKKVLVKIPGYRAHDDDDEDASVDRRVSDSVLNLLKSMRYGDEEATKPKRRKRVAVEAGMSISLEDIQSCENEATSATSKHAEPEDRAASEEESEDEDDDDDDDVEIGRYIVVSYTALSKSYIGKVKSKIHHPHSTGDWRVQFLRRVLGKKLVFQWPDDEDMDNIREDQIVKVLPVPTENRRGQLVFDQCQLEGLLLS